MVRIELAAADSLADMRARSKFGMAIAAIIRMIATTISNSINEKPLCFRISFFSSPAGGTLLHFEEPLQFLRRAGRECERMAIPRDQLSTAVLYHSECPEPVKLQFEDPVRILETAQAASGAALAGIFGGTLGSRINRT